MKTKMAAELEDLLALLATIMRINGTENSSRSGKSEQKVMPWKVLPFFRKHSVGMNRSICFSIGTTGFFLTVWQTVYAQRKQTSSREHHFTYRVPSASLICILVTGCDSSTGLGAATRLLLAEAETCSGARLNFTSGAGLKKNTKESVSISKFSLLLVIHSL